MILSKVIIRDIRTVLSQLNSTKKPTSAYAHHQALWLLFPGDDQEKRPFLFQHTPKIHPQAFLVLSQNEPTLHPSFELQSKAYDPVIQNGDNLHFSLRANPVVTRAKKRNDVVADWKFHFKQQWETDHPGETFPGFPTLGYSHADIVHTQCTQWLKSRSEKHGFKVQHCLAESYHQQGFYKKSQKDGVKISMVDFSGTLTVTDAEAFKKILFEGVGPAKGFGCGLLLIRRTL